MDIETKGMEVAELNKRQLKQLLEAEKIINKDSNQEIYLLAVTRHD